MTPSFQFFVNWFIALRRHKLKHFSVLFSAQITNTEYFAPLLTVNQYSSHEVLEEIPSVDTFARLSNWLMRPVPTVTAAVRRFRERYFEDNYVIGEHVKTVFPTCLPVQRVFFEHHSGTRLVVIASTRLQ